jgi:hypothetical protein
MKKSLYGVILCSILISHPAGAQEFTGAYTLNFQEAVITLQLRQDPTGNLTGTLSGANGATFHLNGKVEEDVAFGICSGEQGGAYFEAEMEGNNLFLTLVEAGANGIPDYSKSRQLTLVRSGPGSQLQPQARSAPPPQDRSPGGRSQKDLGPSGQEGLLKGKYCSWGGSSSSSSSYGRSSWAYFDGQGGFIYGSEASFSSGSGMAYGGGQDGRGSYQIQGETVHLIFEDGSSGAARIFADGNNLGLNYKGALYSPKLCD